MPAIITHDTFGQDAYKILHELIGETRDEYHAFLLGNQGPDPLFYNVLVPSLHKFIKLGSTMHSEKPNELLAALKQSLSILDGDEYPIGRAYMFGFLCHYTLDSTVHPLVFMNEYLLCDAGVDDLDRKDGSEVHAVIESEFDEMVLYTKTQKTVATFDPSTEILRGDAFVLETISKMYVYVSLTTYGLFVPESMFTSSVKSFRRTESVFYSPTGIKRELLGRIEELFRSYSFVRSMSPRAVETTETLYDNHEHSPWKNPFTGDLSTASFWDLYDLSLASIQSTIPKMDRADFDVAAAETITGNLNFSGEPTVAILTVEDPG